MVTPSRRRIPPPPITAANPIEVKVRGDFMDWLAASGGALAITTYNSGKLAVFSAPQGELEVAAWRFPRPMGLALQGDELALASRDHIWRLRLTDQSGEPRAAAADVRPSERRLLEIEHIVCTGRLDAHDLAFDRRGLLLANTRFNCVTRPVDGGRVRVWRPSFVPPGMRQDCCHLNGLGVRDQKLEMVTMFGASGVPGGWREADRFTSGVLFDVPGDRVAARGLCMPHSPRWHANRWWLCNSGEGTLCVLADPSTERVEPVVSLPGFTRGLFFAAGRAVVGLSRIRKEHILDAPPVREKHRRLRAGVALVDVTSGHEMGSLEFVRGGSEVYDALFVPNVAGLEMAPQVAAEDCQEAVAPSRSRRRSR